MIVIDASIALKWVIPEPDSVKAIALRSEQLTAPALWLSELSNALWRKARIGELTDVEAKLFFRQLRGAPVDLVAVENDIERALELGVAIDHPIYDCLYLALAIREGIPLVTADKRFAAAVRQHGRWSAQLRLLSEM